MLYTCPGGTFFGAFAVTEGPSSPSTEACSAPGRGAPARASAEFARLGAFGTHETARAARSIASVENIVTRQLKPWRLALVFTFGLLHGLGFAGVLRDLGLPREEFLTALVTFNLGVEGGQLTVIAVALAATAAAMNKGWYRRRVVIPASMVIAAVGLYWTLVRVVAGTNF